MKTRRSITLAVNQNPAKPGSARIAVENVLKAAKRPLSAIEISELSGVCMDTTRTHLGNLCHHGHARNLCPNTRRAVYVWAMRQAVKAERVVELPERYMPQGNYEPPPEHIRDGGKDHENCWSRRGKELFKPRPPISMGPQS